MIDESTLLTRENSKTATQVFPRHWQHSIFSILAWAILCGQIAFTADFVPKVGPDLKTITVTCGDITLLLRQNTQWTPGRFDFRGSPMTTERSAYGTVFMFPKIGFIGTGHFENEPEDLKSVSFSIDGKSIKTPTESLTGNQFTFNRNSQIRSFSLKNTIKIKENRIFETTTIATEEAVPLALVYNFMHAWTPSVSEYLAGSDDAEASELSELLPATEDANRKFHINKAVDWMAVFDPKSNQFAVSRLLQSPKEAAGISKIWNVKGAYRKFYHTSFQKKTVPAGFSGTWRMVTGFGAANAESWKSDARKLAAELRVKATGG